MKLGKTLPEVGAIILAGVAGASLRWVAAALWHPRAALLVVNIAGCVLVGWALKRNRLGAWFSVGLCGALTSFSAVAIELAMDIDNAQVGTAALWLVATLVGCAAAFVVSFVAPAAPPAPPIESAIEKP